MKGAYILYIKTQKVCQDLYLLVRSNFVDYRWNQKFKRKKKKKEPKKKNKEKIYLYY